MQGGEYSMWGGATLEDESCVMIMRGLTRFTIVVRYARIERTPFGKEYLLRLQHGQNRGNNTGEKFIDHTSLLCSYCLPLLQTLAPQTSIQGLTIEDLCHCPGYRLELVGAADELDVRIEGAQNACYAPSFDISPMPTVDLPKSCRRVPRVHASAVLIEPTPENSDPSDIRTIQGKVKTADGLVKYFKPRLLGREVAFERETSILGRINEAGLRGGETRMSNLVGVVVSGEQGEETLGMLLEWISPSTMGEHLLSEGFWGWHDLHKKWHEQVIATVEKLHKHMIVWGDVNLCNIAIDDALNAWVIDFGGLNNPEFVVDNKRETIEGDWQGVMRIFEEWLPSHQAT
jgi:hypothetical protein